MAVGSVIAPAGFDAGAVRVNRIEFAGSGRRTRKGRFEKHAAVAHHAVREEIACQPGQALRIVPFERGNLDLEPARRLARVDELTLRGVKRTDAVFRAERHLPRWAARQRDFPDLPRLVRLLLAGYQNIFGIG